LGLGSQHARTPTHALQAAAVAAAAASSSSNVAACGFARIEKGAGDLLFVDYNQLPRGDRLLLVTPKVTQKGGGPIFICRQAAAAASVSFRDLLPRGLACGGIHPGGGVSSILLPHRDSIEALKRSCQ